LKSKCRPQVPPRVRAVGDAPITFAASVAYSPAQPNRLSGSATIRIIASGLNFAGIVNPAL
jgi:hypothetical protein